MSTPAISVSPDDETIFASETAAFHAGLAHGQTITGVALIDRLSPDELAAWDGRDEIALVGSSKT